MLNVLERVSEIMLGIGMITLLAGLKGKKTAAFVIGLIITVSGLAVMGLDMIPNEYAKKIETKAVEMKYENWDKQVTVIINKSADSYTTHHNNRSRKHHIYYITYCTTGGLYTETEFNERIPYTEVLINDRLRAVKLNNSGIEYETIAVKESVYYSLTAGETTIAAIRDDTIGKTVEFLVPEYTPESWRKTYGIGEYYDSSDEFDSALHPRRCK